MNKIRFILNLILFAIALPSSGQQFPSTANDYVNNYHQSFGYGANLGNYPPWTNQQVADISAGKNNLPGIGVNAFRGSLPEHFLEIWGYNIRANDYQYFYQRGIRENLAFIGYPAPTHKDPQFYCSNHASELFANLYLPVWDGGINGTPVNENNYFALYVWKIIQIYKPWIRFWEVMNEPDFAWDQTTAFAAPGTPGNWWENDPDPCNNAMYAPIQHYVRMLRISWEVIKTVDPTAYVCTGGIGNPAFLDAILRNTDNPDGGKVTTEYPLRGGAYFDVLSFHSYPHFDGSMWEYPPGGGLVFHRHSDRGIEGLLKRNHAMKLVLEKHGYNGQIFPKKLWLLSETNIPRKPFNVYIGSDEAQRNYIMKALITAHRIGIQQLYVFNIADLSNEANAWNEFLLMGLLKHLSDYSYPAYALNEAAIGWQSTIQFLKNRTFNPTLSQALNLNPSAQGAVFTGLQDTLIVLWAKTHTDMSESASATFTLPATFGMDSLVRLEWNHILTNDTLYTSAANLILSATPSFFLRKPKYVPPPDTTHTAVSFPLYELRAECTPNPGNGNFFLSVETPTADRLLIEFKNQQGVNLWKNIFQVPGGYYLLSVPQVVPAGFYFLYVKSEKYGQKVIKIVVKA